jgi:hypothetical protein
MFMLFFESNHVEITPILKFIQFFKKSYHDMKQVDFM